MQSDKGHDCLTGVGCEVHSCAYHGEDNHCHADNIIVEGEQGKCNCETETFCGTFVAK